MDRAHDVVAIEHSPRLVARGGHGLNHHVSYIHSKFQLMDPLSADPIVVTGSANFSAASTNDNDENMLVIRKEAGRRHLLHGVHGAGAELKHLLL
jgi:phosphatidylserine/phosphatidylglycerophosphate/cardiolipin synthase-like enzyme